MWIQKAIITTWFDNTIAAMVNYPNECILYVQYTPLFDWLPDWYNKVYMIQTRAIQMVRGLSS